MNEFSVVLENVSKIFTEEGKHEIVAVDGVSLTIRKGEIFTLVGPDGAGKTTMIRMMCGVIPPSQGSIEVTGLRMDFHLSEIKTRIGYLAQRFSLYGDLTVDENIDFFAEIHKVRDYERRKLELLDFMRLSPFRGRLAERLSGGMKQKLALACTLIHTPQIIFLDEPTTGVDPVSRRDFWKILSSVLRSGISIVMATPYLDEAERSSRVALINEGKILMCDTPEHVKASFPLNVMEIVCEDPRKAMGLLKGGKGFQSIELFGDRLHIVFDSAKAAMEETLENLRTLGVPATGRTISPSLEDVFISKISR
ncbi:MAG: ABC transporter ATP-binding protein [Ignavibacteriales bacterium]|nr:ABC transporter ATP-binding protein [Ignavibacteriales bacterium]